MTKERTGLLFFLLPQRHNIDYYRCPDEYKSHKVMGGEVFLKNKQAQRELESRVDKLGKPQR